MNLPFFGISQHPGPSDGFFGIPPADTAIKESVQQPNGLGGFLQGDAFGNLLTAAGISLMSSPSNAPLSNFGPALGNAQTAMFRQQQADQEAAQREAEKQRRAELSKYAMSVVPQNLQSMAAVDPDSALKIWESMKPAAPQYTAEQRNWMFAKENPDFAAAMGYGQVPEEIATARNREVLADQQGLSGAARQEFILTGKLPSSGGSIPMSPTIQKELFETDDAILAGQSALTSLQRAMELSKTAYDGPFAEQRGYGGALFGDRGGQATLELTNEVTTQALSQLKVIFGAAPTEGERKILMEIQGSADKPKAVRDAIYQRAYDMAERKLAANQQKAAALRSGTYFSPDYGASTNSVGPGGVPDGVDPSDWQYMTPEERALWQ